MKKILFFVTFILLLFSCEEKLNDEPTEKFPEITMEFISASPGDTIQIVGENFTSGVSVSFGLTSAEILSITNNIIEVIVPNSRDSVFVSVFEKGYTSNQIPFYFPKINPTGTFPIFAYCSIPEDFLTLDRFLEFKESGITMSYSFYTKADYVQTALDLANIAKVKVVAHCPELISQTEVTIKRFRNHPALAGYCLRDEPPMSEFDWLKNYLNLIKSFDDKHFCYINLQPIHAGPEYAGTDDYNLYVNDFAAKVPVEFLSFDFYPINADTLHSDWYYNLEIISNKAKEIEKPFWAFALSTSVYSYPRPKLEHLRLQMYSNLAYGAQGLQYYTYWTPSDHIIGPITTRGARTDIFYLVQQMNREINALSGIFQDSKVINVFHAGNSIPKGTKPLTALPAHVTRLDIGDNDAGIVVSEIEKDDKKFLVIVNKDFNKSITLSISFDKKVKKISKTGAILNIFSQTETITPGDALIYLLQ